MDSPEGLLAVAWQAARRALGGLQEEAAAALAGLQPEVRALLLDGAPSPAAAAEALLTHAAEALVAERLLAREGAELLAEAPDLLAPQGDPAASLFGRAPALVRRAAAAIDEALPTATPALDADLFPRTFSARAQKRRGGVYTEGALAERLLDAVGWSGAGADAGRLLEPAVGAGAFLLPAWTRGLAAGRAPEELARALAAVDVHPYACRAARVALARAAAARGLGPGAVPRVTRADALLAGPPAPSAADGAWDVVIGNPPFVRGERIPAALRRAYRAGAPELGGGNVDLAAYFVLRALRWLRPSGRLGLVVPQGLLEGRACAGLRRALAGHAIEELTSLEWAEGAFADAQVIACLLVVRRAAPAADHRLTLGRARWRGAAAGRALEVERSALPQRRWLELAVSDRWPPFVSRAELPLLERLRAAPTPLVAGYGLAIRTGRGEAAGAGALIADGAPPAHFVAPRPLLDGREVRPWRIEARGRTLDYRPEAISDPKSEAFFRAPKVLVPRIALTPMAAVDTGEPEPFFARNTVMVVRAPGTLLDEGEAGAFALAALINSLPLRAYAFALLRAGALAGSHRATFYAGVIGAFPVPAAILADSAAAAALAALARAAAREAAARRAAALREVEHEVDRAVAAAFGLAPRELEALRARAAQDPLSRVLALPPPGSRTRAIAVRRYAAGERYR